MIKAINEFHYESSSLLKLRERLNSHESINEDSRLYIYKNNYCRINSKDAITIYILVLSFI